MVDWIVGFGCICIGYIGGCVCLIDCVDVIGFGSGIFIKGDDIYG